MALQKSVSLRKPGAGGADVAVHFKGNANRSQSQPIFCSQSSQVLQHAQ